MCIHSTPHPSVVMVHWSFVGQVAASVHCSFQVSGPVDSQSETVGALLKYRTSSTPQSYRWSSVGTIWGKICGAVNFFLSAIVILCFLSGRWIDDGIFLPLPQNGLLEKQGPASHVDKESDGYQEVVEQIAGYDNIHTISSPTGTLPPNTLS